MNTPSAFQHTFRPPYLDYFVLKEEPFSTSSDPRFFYTSEIHRIALEKTKFAVSAKKGLCAVIGDTGTGKTTLAHLLQAQFTQAGFFAALITHPEVPTRFQLLKKIMEKFNYPNYARSYQGTLDRFEQFLHHQEANKQTMVLLIDEAQTIGFKLLEFLRQLTNFESEDKTHKLLQLVLLGQEELRAILNNKRAKNIKNRIALLSNLEGLSVAESAKMIQHRWGIAGGGKSLPFTQDAFEAFYEYSKGIPRNQVKLADNTLLAATLAQKKVIDRQLVDEVAKDQGFA